MVKRTMTKTVQSSGRGGTAAAMAQNGTAVMSDVKPRLIYKVKTQNQSTSVRFEGQGYWSKFTGTG